MGHEVFDEVHEIILRFRSVEDFDVDEDAQDELLYTELMSVVKGLKSDMNLAFKLDGIVYSE